MLADTEEHIVSSQPQVIWYDWGIKCKGKRAGNDVGEAGMSQIVAGLGSRTGEFRLCPAGSEAQEEEDTY